MKSVPATRSLPIVLRRQSGDGGGVRLILATGGAAVAGADAAAYVNVVIEGETLKVPRLKEAAVPAVGGPAYVLASADFFLYLGTVSTA